MANKKISIRLGEILPLLEDDAKKLGKPVSQMAVAIIADHYGQPEPTYEPFFSDISKAKKAQKKAVLQRKKNSGK